MNGALPLLRDTLLSLLKSNGILAMEAFPSQTRRLQEEPLVLVSVKELHADASGFLNYLGVRFDSGRETWDEIYGQSLRLHFALDLYSPKKEGEIGMQGLMDRISELLTTQSPSELSLCELSWGEFRYEKSCDMFLRKGTLLCEGMLYRRQDDEGGFLSFEVKGGMTLG